MSFKRLEVTIRSTSPMLMHNGQLADPTNEISKAMRQITSKRVKTEEDLERLKELEFLGGLYIDEDGEPCIPGDVLEATLRAGATVKRNGRKIAAGAFVENVSAKLEYEGPKTPEEMWKNPNFSHTQGVRVGQNRVMRTRPRFNQWQTTFNIQFVPDAINKQEIVDAIEDAGLLKGIGDYRPRFGRFEVTEIVEND